MMEGMPETLKVNGQSKAVGSEPGQVDSTVSATKQSNREFKSHDVFVGNLSKFTTDDRLKTYMEHIGPVKNVRIMYHPENKKSRRFGFVTFANRASVDKALATTNFFLDGNSLDFKPAFKKMEEQAREYRRQSSEVEIPKIFIGGIGQDVAYEDLMKYFSKFGKIKECFFPFETANGNRHKGFAFIAFESPDVARLLTSQKFHSLGSRQVEVKFAQTKPKFSHTYNKPTPSGDVLKMAATQWNKTNLPKQNPVLGPMFPVPVLPDYSFGQNEPSVTTGFSYDGSSTPSRFPPRYTPYLLPSFQPQAPTEPQMVFQPPPTQELTYPGSQLFNTIYPPMLLPHAMPSPGQQFQNMFSPYFYLPPQVTSPNPLN